jgi:hypothetical protein
VLGSVSVQFKIVKLILKKWEATTSDQEIYDAGLHILESGLQAILSGYR